jgi:hypothetical protein
MEICRAAPALGGASLALWLMAIAALCTAVYVGARISSSRRSAVVLRATRGHVRRKGTTLHFTDADVAAVHTAAGTVEFGNGIEVQSCDIGIVDRGGHIASGRGIRVKVASQNPGSQVSSLRILNFPSRFAVEAFRDALHHAQGNSSRPDAVKLALSTWNLGNAQPPSDLASWLNTSGDADIVAVGTQECSYAAVCVSTETRQSDDAQQGATSANEGIASKTDHPGTSHSTCLAGKEHWQAVLKEHFADTEFVNLIDVASWDRCLAVYVRRSVMHAVSRVSSDTAFVGLGGMAGNKGAIGVRFAVYDTEFVIVNSHLAAHQGEVERRNQDFASIVASLRALRDHPNLDVLSSTFHHIFWVGDLNYRIDLRREEVCDLVAAEKFEAIAVADQLGIAIRAGNAFLGFHEGELSFAPTYRFERGSRRYETTKMRVPSYTDRVLWRTLPGVGPPTLLSYFAVNSILTSDHNPVVALLEAPLVHTTGVRDLEEIGEDASPSDDLDDGEEHISNAHVRDYGTFEHAKEINDPGTAYVLEFTDLAGHNLPTMDGTTQYLVSKLGSSISWGFPGASGRQTEDLNDAGTGDGFSRPVERRMSTVAIDDDAIAGRDSSTSSDGEVGVAVSDARRGPSERRLLHRGRTSGVDEVESIDGEDEEGSGILSGGSKPAISRSAAQAKEEDDNRGCSAGRGYCDPYCVFHGDAVAELSAGEYRSAVLAETQNPVWDALHEVPPLALADGTGAVVRRRHLTITVMDADAGPTDGVVGSVVLSLGAGWAADAADGVVAAADFEQVILRRGQARGWLTGRYLIRDRRGPRGRR